MVANAILPRFGAISNRLADAQHNDKTISEPLALKKLLAQIASDTKPDIEHLKDGGVLITAKLQDDSDLELLIAGAAQTVDSSYVMPVGTSFGDIANFSVFHIRAWYTREAHKQVFKDGIPDFNPASCNFSTSPEQNPFLKIDSEDMMATSQATVDPGDYECTINGKAVKLTVNDIGFITKLEISDTKAAPPKPLPGTYL